MIAVDSSVTVAAYATWHESHDAARRTIAGEIALPAHVVIETYSVLTRMPPPHRAPPRVVASWLAQFTTILDPLDAIDGSAHLSLITRLAHDGVSGGASYDALVAQTCLDHGATLVTNDARASRTYEVLGVDAQPLH
jgi:predicted nucleic acid-binding protein